MTKFFFVFRFIFFLGLFCNQNVLGFVAESGLGAKSLSELKSTLTMIEKLTQENESLKNTNNMLSKTIQSLTSNIIKLTTENDALKKNQPAPTPVVSPAKPTLTPPTTQQAGTPVSIEQSLNEPVQKIITTLDALKQKLSEFSTVLNDINPTRSTPNFTQKIDELIKKIKDNTQAAKNKKTDSKQEQQVLTDAFSKLTDTINGMSSQIENLQTSFQETIETIEPTIKENFVEKIDSINQKIKDLFDKNQNLDQIQKQIVNLLSIVEKLKINPEDFDSILQDATKINNFISSVQEIFQSLEQIVKKQKQLTKSYFKISNFESLDKTLALEQKALELVKKQKIQEAISLLGEQ